MGTIAVVVLDIDPEDLEGDFLRHAHHRHLPDLADADGRQPVQGEIKRDVEPDRNSTVTDSR
jgi:hypothetical protein